MAIKAIADATGLPVTIDELNIDIIPTPCVRARRIEIGEKDFRASVDSVRATVRLRDLLSGRVTIPEIVLTGVTVTTPEALTQLSAKYHMLKFTSSSGEAGKSGKVSIGEIQLHGARVLRGAGADPAAIVDLEVRNPISETIGITAHATLPTLGKSPQVRLGLTLSRTEGVKGITGIQGSFNLDGVQLAELVEGENAPKATLSAEASITGKTAEDIAFLVSGQVEPAPGEPAEVQAIAGPFTAKAWWKQDQFIVNDLSWRAPGLTWTGDFTRSPEGEVACNFPEILFNQASLAPLLGLIPKSDIHLSATSGAKLEGRDLLMGITKDGQYRFVKGTVSASGVRVEHKGVEALTHVSADIELKEGVVQVTRLAADGVTLSGTAKPDLGERSLALELAGQVELSRKRLSPFLELAAVPKLEGLVVLKRVAATIAPGKGIPRDLVIEGALTKGSVQVETAQYHDTISGIRVDFVTVPGSITTKAAGASKLLGTLSCDGAYQVKSASWDGTINADTAQVVAAFLKTADQKRVVGPLVAQYGDAPFRVTCELPQAKADALTIAVSRTADPPLQGEVRFANSQEGLKLGSITAKTVLPVNSFAHVLPPAMETSGSIPISFVRTVENQTFQAQADLTDCSMKAGRYISKKSGAKAAIDVRGQTLDGAWAANSLLITLLDQQLQAKMADGDIAFDKLDVRLEALAGLLSNGAKARGRITGSAHTAPAKFDLTLSEVGVSLTPELGLDSVSGAVAFAGSQWTVRDLRVHSANSECAVTGKADANGWHGAITGAKLDVNAIQALADEAKAVTGAKKEPSDEPAPSKGFSGDLTVDIDSVFYRRARFDKFHADMQVRPGITRLRNMKTQPYSGWVTGAIDFVSAKPGAKAMVDLDLTLDSIDARIIDAISTKEPRNYTGTLSGKVRLQMPTGEGVDPINGATGTIRIAGQNGSLGKMGIATKALGVLRAVELIRLRMPSLKDEGLLYDTLACSLSLDSGVMTIEKFELANTSLAANAEGVLDFPRLESDARIRVHPLEAVTGLVEDVPLIGKAVTGISKQGGLLLLVKGSPYEPTIRFEGTGATEEVREATKKGGAALKDTVKKTAGDAINRLLGR